MPRGHLPPPGSCRDWYAGRQQGINRRPIGAKTGTIRLNAGAFAPVC